MITALNATFKEWFSQYGFPIIFLAIVIAAFVVMMVFQNKKRKKQEKEAKDLIDSVKPGNKVKTIGGVCGIVVEVDSEENTFVLETGSVTAGKSYVKFDRQAIWQTDAVVENKDEKSAEPAEVQAEESSEEPENPESRETAKENVSENNVSENK